MYEGRLQSIFYAGISKFIGIGVMIILSLIMSLLNFYGSVGFEGYIIYTATSECLRYLFDIIFFLLIAIGFNQIYDENPRLIEANKIFISSVVYTMFLLADIVMVILLFTIGSEVVVYITGAFYILTAFPAIYACLKLYGYFDKTETTNKLKILNYSFIILGFAIMFQFILIGIGIMLPASIGIAFQTVSNTFGSVAYVVFIIAASATIIHSKEPSKFSRVTEVSL